MELITILAVIGIALLLYGYNKYSNKRKEVGKFAMVIGGVALLVVGMQMGGYIAPLSAVDFPAVGQQAGQPVSGAEVKNYGTVAVVTQVYGSNSYTAASGTVNFYEEGVDPTSSNSNAYDTATIASGVGNTTANKLMSATNYGIVFDGSTTYYDQWYNSVAYPATSQLPYTKTDAATISIATIKFNDIRTVGTISDPIDESAVAGLVNGQTAVANSTTSLLEIAVGTAVTPANGDILYYNKTAGDGQFYLDITIGFEGANKVVKQPVLSFVNDLTNRFDGNEFSSVTLVKQSGTDFGAPRDITNYVNNADNVPLGSMAEGGDSGVYRLTFNMDESLLTAGGDIMYIYVDDLGDHLGQDILKGTKATASSAITIAVIA